MWLLSIDLPKAPLVPILKHSNTTSPLHLPLCCSPCSLSLGLGFSAGATVRVTHLFDIQLSRSDAKIMTA